MSDNEKEKLEFKVSSGLKNIIGKDLITDDFIAIFEIVKNSYDARAKNVIITFEDKKIIIADNGKGMSYDDLRDKWLFVGFSAKKDGTEDIVEENLKKKSYRDEIQSRRHYAGEKGIGRFSSDRLGRFLKLTSQKKGEKKAGIIFIDWKKFEKNQNNIFESIKVDYEPSFEKVEFPSKSKHGTVLEITGVTSSWNRVKLKKLKHSLEKLINPFAKKNEFSIEIICPRESNEDKKKDANGNFVYIKRDRINGRVGNSILEVLKIKTTHINVLINSESIISKIFDRGNLIYHIEEKNQEYKLLQNVQIDLYFLNSSAKNNFTRKMGIRVVNFGSVFLFKNGFRIQPYGEPGDDSWGLDYRSQQGYNRFLGSRDLFGRVEIISDNSELFKEVSSRDGGLVETAGYVQMMDVFLEKGLRRLERYVVGVLWGEAFKRKKYFGEGPEASKKAELYREELKQKDRNSSNISIAKSNLGSKIDFIQMIKSLVSNKNIEIIDYDRDFVDLVNEKLDEHQSRFISDLENIADETNDTSLKKKILKAEKRFQKLLKEKERAEAKAEEEEKKREEEERKRKEEEIARKEAEKKQKKEEERRRKAELATLKKEKQRAEAELAKLKAEKRAEEEEKKRKKAESEAARRKEQITLFKASETIEYKDLRDSNHIIGVYSDDISKKILLFKRKLDRGKKIEEIDLISFLKGISLTNEKISTLTRFTTKANYLKAALETDQNIVGFITNYINNIYKSLYRIKIDIINEDISFVKKFQPIELSVAIDNILSNSRKKGAKKVIFEFNQIRKGLEIRIRDVGLSLSTSIEDWKLIFEEGVTTTKGSGLGLSHVKRIIEEDLGSTITYNPDYKKGFELIITIKK